jgi:hypothetical protein
MKHRERKNIKRYIRRAIHNLKERGSLVYRSPGENHLCVVEVDYPFCTVTVYRNGKTVAVYDQYIYSPNDVKIDDIHWSREHSRSKLIDLIKRNGHLAVGARYASVNRWAWPNGVVSVMLIDMLRPRHRHAQYDAVNLDHVVAFLEGDIDIEDVHKLSHGELGETK